MTGVAQVYRGQVLDLLGERARLEVLEDGRGRVQVVGLHEIQIWRADELLGLVAQAEEIRATGATSANEQSSRSHAILQVVLRERESGRQVSTQIIFTIGPDVFDFAMSIPKASHHLPPLMTTCQVGKLSLVDLAGSERAADASSKDRQTRIEGAEINKSLLCLKVSAIAPHAIEASLRSFTSYPGGGGYRSASARSTRARRTRPSVAPSSHRCCATHLWAKRRP